MPSLVAGIVSVGDTLSQPAPRSAVTSALALSLRPASARVMPSPYTASNEVWFITPSSMTLMVLRFFTPPASLCALSHSRTKFVKAATALASSLSLLIS